MDQEKQIKQAEDDFLSGFNDVRSSDEPVSPEPKKEAEPESQSVAEESQEVEKQEPEQELPVIAGLTESEIKNLFARVSKLDELEAQVRKANGKIGELNGKLQEFSTKPQTQPTQSAPAAKFDDESLSQWANDYPELVAIAEKRALEIAEEKFKAIQLPDPQAIKSEIYRETQMELMDTLHEGWREKIASEDFNIWINAQPDNVRQVFQTTERAKDLSGVLTGFENWKKNVSDRGAKNKQRLEAALTPDGAPSRGPKAPSDEDEFIAGFRSIRPA